MWSGGMYSPYHVGEDLEDAIYQEDEGDSEASEINSELEFRLYSQLHYSSNAGDIGELVDTVQEAEGQVLQQLEATSEPADGDKENEERRVLSPDANNIDLNKKKIKQSIKKKRKTDPEKQNLTFSFEEVIVIDSSPEVISVSDDNDSSDDTGVCNLKQHRSQRRQTSTPSQQETQKSIRALGTPLSVDSSSLDSDSGDSGSNLGSSDSSDLSDSDDSDDLENWMILGRGNQDGDQSISLNLEGKFDSNADLEDPEDWLVSNKDKEAQIYNRDRDTRAIVPQLSHRYYTSKNVQCRNCNKYGHLSKNCPEPKKMMACFLCGIQGHLASQCPNKHCNNCGLPGHLYDSCTERAYWHKQCHRCSMTGHFFDVCPEIWRQYHITIKAGVPVKQQEKEKLQTSVYCYNCARKGHHGYMCTKQKMYNGMYPNTPFINQYDTVEDIKRRRHRIKLKVRDLRMNGHFPASPQSLSTQEPSKKKQKLNHHKNNSQSNNTPKHIFFNDKCKLKGPSYKTKTYKAQEGTSGVKPWQPKRPVPTSREMGGKIIFDEADDFPRGGNKGQNKKRFKKSKRVPEEQSIPNRPSWLGETAAAVVAAAPPHPGKRKKKRGRGSRVARKIADMEMYPTDENLFIIKQRRRTR